MLSLPAATACAAAGEIEHAHHHLRLAEMSAVLWEGTAWEAALAEARAHVAGAEGDAEGSRRQLRLAVEGFAQAGQPLDARRCEAHLVRLTG